MFILLVSCVHFIENLSYKVKYKKCKYKSIEMKLSELEDRIGGVYPQVFKQMEADRLLD